MTPAEETALSAKIDELLARAGISPDFQLLTLGDARHLFARLAKADSDRAEAQRELAESRRIWHEKRDELTAFTEQLVGVNGNLQRLVESAKAVGCVVQFDGHERFVNQRAEQLAAERQALVGLGASLREVVLVLDSPPHTCPECRHEVGGGEGWRHGDDCRVAMALELSEGLPERHDKAVIAAFEGALVAAIRDGKLSESTIDQGVSFELAEALSAFVVRTTRAELAARAASRQPLHAAAEPWLHSMLAEAAECLSYDARNALRLVPEAVEQLRAVLQAWRDGLSFPQPVVSRELVEEAFAELVRYVIELPPGVPGSGIARAHLLLKEALG